MATEKVTVDLKAPSFYAEPSSRFYGWKRRATYRDVLKRLQPVLERKSDKAVLEVGTGSGFLLRVLENKFPCINLTGLEFDPRLVELTRSKVKRATVIEANAESFSLPGKFDAIVSCQVIEHLYHPDKMIERVAVHLNVGGVFVMTTPNLGGFGAKAMGKKWHGYRTDHVSLKTYDQWVAFVESHGFDTLYAGSTFFSGIPILNRFPLGVFNWTLLLLLGSLRWKRGESFVGAFIRK